MRRKDTYITQKKRKPGPENKRWKGKREKKKVARLILQSSRTAASKKVGRRRKGKVQCTTLCLSLSSLFGELSGLFFDPVALCLHNINASFACSFSFIAVVEALAHITPHRRCCNLLCARSILARVPLLMLIIIIIAVFIIVKMDPMDTWGGICYRGRRRIGVDDRFLFPLELALAALPRLLLVAFRLHRRGGGKTRRDKPHGMEE